MGLGRLQHCKFEQHYDLYIETDLHLLADVFKNVRDLCIDM